jgi:formimidoylglutamate deiminase
MSILFQPDLLFTGGRFQAGAGVFVDARGRIERVTSNGEAVPGAEIIRFRGKALLPGFANVHSHAFQRLIRGRTESRRSGGRDFWTWRGAMYHAAATLTPEQMYHTARMTFLEMALAGTTTVGEFHYVHRRPDGGSYPEPNEMARQVIAAARSAGIRIALLRSAYQRAGYELPPDPGQTRFLEPTEEFLANTEALAAEYHSEASWVGVAPHSVRAVPLIAIEQIAAGTRDRGLPLHMHVSEQVAEVEACRREYGTTPVRLLAEHGLLGGDFTAVHAVHIDREEMDLLSESGATICSCPTTERNLGDGIFPAREVMERGIPVAFGSDSQAQIEPWEDARELDYHLRLQQQKRSLLDGIHGEEMSARLFRCATANGAAALKCDSGEIAPGKLADFFTIDLNDPSMAGSDEENLLSAVVFGMNRNAIADVAVGGKLIVRDHRHAAQGEILNQYQEVAREVWNAPQLAAK